MNSALYCTEDHLARAREFVSLAHAHGGLAPLDLEQFWHDNDIACRDPFAPDIPQCPLGIMMSWECIPAELGISMDIWRFQHDPGYAAPLIKAYNDRAERIVGRRLLNETPPDPARQYPRTKSLADVFEARNVWHADSWWLEQSAHDEASLAALLDRVDARDIRSFILPDNWHAHRDRLMPLAIKPPLYRRQRGPVTFAMSVFGPENLIFLIMDNPTLAARFRDTILRVMLDIARVLDEEAGFSPHSAPHGFYFYDDNCSLLSPELYEFFGYPILKAIFDRYSPAPADMRGQHSDSPMGHLLPLLGSLNLTTVNFGPTLRAQDIRAHLPRAVIHGQLAPFTFSRNEEVNIVAEFLRDFDATRDQRGLVFATAGSINNGSMLSGMRLIMAAIQRFGRYND